MTQWLVLEVRFHDGRYHGKEDGFDSNNPSDGWPPSPGRLFQALVAGVAHGSEILPDDRQALHWLENLPPPRISAPPAYRSEAVPMFVPNNDLDACGGDPGQVAKVRVQKHWRPHLFDADEPIFYLWKIDTPTTDAERICNIANRLYQLGRGIDMAAASGAVMTDSSTQELLESHPGTVRIPIDTEGGNVPVPQSGTLDSLIMRQRCRRDRLTFHSKGRKGDWHFTQPPKARFRYITYDAPPKFLYFDLRREDLPQHSAWAPRPLRTAAALVTGLRDGAALRLKNAAHPQSKEIERLIVGKGAGPNDVAQRLRIIPVPSIGTEHTDPSIRRMLVEVPPTCPIPWRDIQWAFGGLSPYNLETGEAWPGYLVSQGDSKMIRRYLPRNVAVRRFRSLTAVALSQSLLPRSYTNHSVAVESTTAEHRHLEETRAIKAVVQALRHASVRVRPSGIRVQREPLHSRGIRAEDFAEGSRFPRRAMWHVELKFPSAIPGPFPLVIGDGRFCGLGLMEPISDQAVENSKPTVSL